MKYLIAAVSALAMAATPALAQGNGNGNGRGNDRGAQSDNRGNGNGNAQRGNNGQGNGNAQANRGNNGQANRGNGNGNRGNGQQAQGNRGNGGGNGNAQVNRGNGNGNGSAAVRSVNRGNNGNGNGNGNRNNGRDGIDLRIDTRGGGGLIDRVIYRETGLLDGCPPGLAAKRNGCLPPGQARQLNDRYTRYSRYTPNWWGLPYSGGSYFYDDGFLLRYSGGRVSSYIPLLGGALSIGNRWPGDYGYNSVPSYYTNYYGLGNNYRYADNVVYRLDPETTAITSIAALLTGDEFVVGSPMPRGYDVYNVPYSYRQQYYDRPDAMYRYNNGYVYQIDPETRLVAAAIELLL